MPTLDEPLARLGVCREASIPRGGLTSMREAYWSTRSYEHFASDEGVAVVSGPACQAVPMCHQGYHGSRAAATLRELDLSRAADPDGTFRPDLLRASSPARLK